MKKILSILALALAAMTASAEQGFTLSVGTSEHGTIAFTNAEGTAIETAAEGQTVTVTVTPAEGYVVNQPTGQWYAAVARARSIDMLNEVTLTAAGENKWTFTMERANVEISATYKKVLQAGWITVASATYNGKALEPTVTVKDGSTVVDPSNYSVAYSDNVNAGSNAKVTITMNGSNADYAGKVEKTFTISPAQLTAVTLKEAEYIYIFSDITVEVASVKAGDLDVPKSDYTVSGNVAKEVGTYTLTVTGKGNFTGTFTATYKIKEPEPTIDVEATETTTDNEQEGKAVDNVTMVMSVTEDAAENVTTEERTNPETGETETVFIIPCMLLSTNIPESTSAENITLTVPSEIRQGTTVFKVTIIKENAFISTDDNKKVTKVILSHTDELLTIEEGAMKPEGRLLEVETPLQDLDDYALMKSLQENFEAKMISAQEVAPNKYFTFSSGVDCILPEDTKAFITLLEDGVPRIVELTEEQLKLADGRRGIKANNGVLLRGEKGKKYEFVANPGSQESGTVPATTNAKSYEGNCLAPTIVATNYQAGKVLILKDNHFYPIKSNASKVSPCKAVLLKN